MFRPIWPSSGVKMFCWGNCCFCCCCYISPRMRTCVVVSASSLLSWLRCVSLLESAAFCLLSPNTRMYLRNLPRPVYPRSCFICRNIGEAQFKAYIRIDRFKACHENIWSLFSVFIPIFESSTSTTWHRIYNNIKPVYQKGTRNTVTSAQNHGTLPYITHNYCFFLLFHRPVF
jgi:hypothetical protein